MDDTTWDSNHRRGNGDDGHRPLLVMAVLLAVVVIVVGMAYITRCVRAQMEGNDQHPPPQPQPPQPQPQPPILPLVRPPLPPARKFSEDDEQAECSICLEEFEAGVDVRRLGSCGHLFHLICIDQWLEGQATCPLCRGSVV